MSQDKEIWKLIPEFTDYGIGFRADGIVVWREKK